MTIFDDNRDEIENAIDLKFDSMKNDLKKNDENENKTNEIMQTLIT
jgi:hypothetical protein